MSGSDKKKLAVAIVLLVLVALVFAWNFGLFEGGSSRAPAPAATEGEPIKGQPRVAPGGKK